jgi:hypothetical protein
MRAKHDLQIKFQAFIADEMQDWARLFSEEFWLALARLEGIRYSPRSRPLRWAAPARCHDPIFSPAVQTDRLPEGAYWFDP